MRIAFACLAVAGALFGFAGSADAHLTKRHARAGAARYLGSMVWALDEAQSGERLHVRPPRFCRRLTPEKVACQFSVRLVSEPKTLRGSLVVHHQRDGLLGFLLPWDPADVCACDLNPAWNG